MLDMDKVVCNHNPVQRGEETAMENGVDFCVEIFEGNIMATPILSLENGSNLVVAQHVSEGHLNLNILKLEGQEATSNNCVAF